MRWRQDASADAGACQGRHWAGSSSDQQLLAQSQARQRSRLLTPLGSSWLHGPLARCLSCLLGYIMARAVRGPL